MSDEDDVTNKTQRASDPGEWRFPSWRRVGEFVASILQLERSVASLKEENKLLRNDLKEVHRQLVEQGAKVELLSDFVQSSLRDQVDSRAEKAAIHAVEVMLALTRALPRDPE